MKQHRVLISQSATVRFSWKMISAPGTIRAGKTAA
jgi:hypothetical protein